MVRFILFFSFHFLYILLLAQVVASKQSMPSTEQSSSKEKTVASAETGKFFFFLWYPLSNKSIYISHRIQGSRSSEQEVSSLDKGEFFQTSNWFVCFKIKPNVLISRLAAKKWPFLWKKVGVSMTQATFLKKSFLFFLENVANRSHRDRRPSEKIVAIR